MEDIPGERRLLYVDCIRLLFHQQEQYLPELQTDLQQAAGVDVSDQIIRNRLMKARHHLVGPLLTAGTEESD